jgi:hypothetical protein
MSCIREFCPGSRRRHFTDVPDSQMPSPPDAQVLQGAAPPHCIGSRHRAARTCEEEGTQEDRSRQVALETAYVLQVRLSFPCCGFSLMHSYMTGVSCDSVGRSYSSEGLEFVGQEVHAIVLFTIQRARTRNLLRLSAATRTCGSASTPSQALAKPGLESLPRRPPVPLVPHLRSHSNLAVSQLALLGAGESANDGNSAQASTTTRAVLLERGRCELGGSRLARDEVGEEGSEGPQLRVGEIGGKGEDPELWLGRSGERKHVGGGSRSRRGDRGEEGGCRAAGVGARRG